MSKQVRCYVKKEKSNWVGVCIDFNLNSQGTTYKETKLKLIHMINSYMIEELFSV